jgi:uncharacterized protein YegJ (DUF2314 family)
MPIPLKPPGGDKTLPAAIFLIGGIFCLIWGAPKTNPYLLGLGVIFLICGAGLWMDQQWGRWFTIVALVLFSIVSGVMMFTKGFTWIRLGSVLAPIWTAWQVWKDFAPTQDGEDEPDEEKRPLISLVLLLREARYLEAGILANIISSAWSETYTAGDETEEESERFVVGDSPTFIIQSPRALFMLHNFSRPYFDDVEAAAKAIKELRLRKAIEDHTAWISVDLIAVHDKSAAPDSMYPWIARLIAELAGPHCTAIYQPEAKRINVWDESLEEKLRGPNPLQDFVLPAHPPVIPIEDDDPRLQAAVAEARSRWPEFVEAFKTRSGDKFAIKAPLRVEEHTEYIWIEVTGLEPEYIHGTIGNEPVALEGMKLGDQVEVPVKDLNDWMFVREAKAIGLFTIKVIDEAQKRPNA